MTDPDAEWLDDDLDDSNEPYCTCDLDPTEEEWVDMKCACCGKEIFWYAQCPDGSCDWSTLGNSADDALRAWNTRTDAADALRAQVAALQAENEKLQKTASYQLAIANRAVAEKLYAELAQCKAELAAAQAKLAVPVPEDVRDTISYLRGNPDCPGSSDERDIADMLTALARDNAALRTKAEALELERSERALDKMAENAKELGLDYDAMKPDGPLTKREGRRDWKYCTSRGYEIGQQCEDVADCARNGCALGRGGEVKLSTAKSRVQRDDLPSPYDLDAVAAYTRRQEKP